MSEYQNRAERRNLQRTKLRKTKNEFKKRTKNLQQSDNTCYNAKKIRKEFYNEGIGTVEEIIYDSPCFDPIHGEQIDMAAVMNEGSEVYATLCDTESSIFNGSEETSQDNGMDSIYDDVSVDLTEESAMSTDGSRSDQVSELTTLVQAFTYPCDTDEDQSDGLLYYEDDFTTQADTPMALNETEKVSFTQDSMNLISDLSISFTEDEYSQVNLINQTDICTFEDEVLELQVGSFLMEKYESALDNMVKNDIEQDYNESCIHPLIEAIGVQKAVNTNEAFFTEEVVGKQKPVVVQEAIHIQEPVDTQELDAAQEAAVAVQEPTPAVAKELAAVKEPAAVQEPAAVKEPVAVKERVSSLEAVDTYDASYAYEAVGALEVAKEEPAYIETVKSHPIKADHSQEVEEEECSYNETNTTLSIEEPSSTVTIDNKSNESIIAGPTMIPNFEDITFNLIPNMSMNLFEDILGTIEGIKEYTEGLESKVDTLIKEKEERHEVKIVKEKTILSSLYLNKKGSGLTDKVIKEVGWVVTPPSSIMSVLCEETTSLLTPPQSFMNLVESKIEEAGDVEVASPVKRRKSLKKTFKKSGILVPKKLSKAWKRLFN